MRCFVYVGGFSNTIEVFELSYDLADPEGALLQYKESSKVSENPSFLTATPDGIYSIHEVSTFKGEKSGGLSFSKMDETFKVRRIQEQFSCGSGPCHLLVNNVKKCIYMSNYESGHLGVTKINSTGMLDGGMFVESYDTGSNVVRDRQGESHPHGTCFRGKFVYVVDLGGDRIYHYQHGSGIEFSACQKEYTATPPGSGPRHMVFHPKYDIAFVITELSNEIITYKFNSNNGILTKVKSHKFITEELLQNDVTINYGAEIVVHPNGKFLYISNRGNGALISYRIIDANGSLEKIEVVRLGGTWPRHFDIHSSGKVLICADQFKEEIYLFIVDDYSGRLRKVQTVTCTNKPSCIAFSN